MGHARGHWRHYPSYYILKGDLTGEGERSCFSLREEMMRQETHGLAGYRRPPLKGYRDDAGLMVGPASAQRTRNETCERV
jgi:hypothetical protein